MKASIKRLFGIAADKLGIISLARKKSPSDEVTVLMFHKVRKTEFEQQVIYLKKYYNIISEKQLYDFFYHNKSLPNNSVLITFDDGYLNNYTDAWPVLKKHNAPALIFLTTNFIGKQDMAWFDKVEYAINNTKKKSLFFDGKNYSLTPKVKKKLIKKYYYHAITLPNKSRRAILDDLFKETAVSFPKKTSRYSFMSWNQVHEMQELVSFGAHTHNHPVLPNCTQEEKAQELTLSIQTIKKHLGHTPISFCYPNGDYDRETLEEVKRAGFKLAFSSNFGRNKKSINPFLIQRIGINVLDTYEIFASKLSNLSRFFTRTKTRRHFYVVMITNYYFPQTGGITTSVHNLVTLLRRFNIKTTVLAYPHLFRKIERLFNDSRSIHRFLVICFFIWTTIFLLIARLFHRKVIVHSHSANFCARAGLLMKSWGVKTVHTFRTDFSDVNASDFVTPHPYLDKVDTLTAVSKTLGEHSAKKYAIKKEILTIYNGVIDFDKIPKKSNLQKNKVPVILYIGHLLDIKDPLLFVKSIQALDIPAKAVLVGEGPLRGQIEAYVKEHHLNNITLLGSIPKSAIYTKYKKADVLVLTSKGEGLGNVVLEAMSANVPVVATDVGGIHEIITSKVNGILVSSRSPKVIAAAIKEALENSATLTKNAQQVLHEQFDLQKAIKQYINIYRRLTLEKNFQSSEENAP